MSAHAYCNTISYNSTMHRFHGSISPSAQSFSHKSASQTPFQSNWPSASIQYHPSNADVFRVRSNNLCAPSTFSIIRFATPSSFRRARSSRKDLSMPTRVALSLAPKTVRKGQRRTDRCRKPHETYSGRETPTASCPVKDVRFLRKARN